MPGEPFDLSGPVELDAPSSARQWQFLVALNDKLRALRDPREIQNSAARLLGAHLRVNRVQYADIEGDEFIVRSHYASGVVPFIGRGPVTTFEAFVDAYRRGETVAVNDVRTDARFSDVERTRLLSLEIASFVDVMLHKEGRWLAAFSVHSATPRTWTREEIALVEIVADRTWSAVVRATTEDALRWRQERDAFLLALSDAIRPLQDPARILAVACRMLGRHLKVSRVAYGEIDGDDCVIVDEYLDGVAPQARRFRWTNRGGSRTGEILKGGTIVVDDVATSVHTASEREALQASEVGAYVTPLLVKDGRFVGAFGIHHRTPREWTEAEIGLIQEVADRTWAALERRKAEAALRTSEERLAFLLRLNDALRPLSDPGDVQETAARLLGEQLGANRVGYAEIEGAGYVIHREYARGVAPLVGRGPTGSFGAALVDAYRRGETVIVNDVQTDPRFTEAERISMDARQIQAMVGVTLLKGGKLVAAFGANHATPRHWTPAEIELIHDVAVRTWDAVERTVADAALREREQRLRLALDASAGGSWTWDAKANRVDWDEAFRLRYGFSPDEPASFEAWLALVHEEDRAQIIGMLQDVLQSTTRTTWDNTFRITHRDGTMLWIQSLGRAERDVGGAVTRLTGLELDVTERRRIEAAVRARRDEEHDRELRLLLETAAQGIVSVNAQGVIVTANRALEKMFGWEPGELVGQKIEDLLPATLRAGHTQHRAAYFSAPHPRLMGAGLALVGQRKDKSTFPIEVSLNHVATPTGGRAIAFVTDITERQRARAVLQERTAELERRTVQLRQLASDLTLAEQHAREQLAKTLHDGLQQLLVSAALNVERQIQRDAQRGGDSSSSLVQAKSHLDEAIADARSLSFDLFPPLLHGSGLPAALTWLAERTRNQYGLTVQVSADPRANSDRKDVRTLLFESVRELLFNAVKHAEVERVRLDLTLDDDDDTLRITVADEGIGFDPATLADGANGGQMGWGLFSIRERLTLLGGRFEIDSAPGRGTRFGLIAPRSAGSRVAATVDALRQSPGGGGPAIVTTETAGRPLTIVIADDHQAVVKVFKEILEEFPKFRVVGEAANGLDAIALARAFRPDVVLMDVSMPHMDGIEATRRLCSEFPSMKILGISTEPRTEERHPIELAGAAGFFTKGTDTQRLIDRLLAIHTAMTGVMS